jgi:hypothetical protein
MQLSASAVRPGLPVCGAASLHAATRAQDRGDDAALRERLRKISEQRPRWGTAARIIGCARRVRAAST